MTEIKMYWHSGYLTKIHKGKKRYCPCLFNIALSGRVIERPLKRSFRYLKEAEDYAKRVASHLNRRQGIL